MAYIDHRRIRVSIRFGTLDKRLLMLTARAVQLRLIFLTLVKTFRMSRADQ
jgi:hypothetical protein